MVSKDAVYGGVVASKPIFFPSTLNCTPRIWPLSLAVAETLTVSETVELETGEEIDTDGGMLSG